MYTEVRDDWTDPESGIRYTNEFTPVWRWRRAMVNNCQARFDWCVRPYSEANHHPRAAVDGDRGDGLLRRTVAPGRTVSLDASATTDPDGDALTLLWWIYREASSYRGTVTIRNRTASKAEVMIPPDAADTQLHVILEVKDQNPIVALYDYRWIVIDVEPPS